MVSGLKLSLLNVRAAWLTGCTGCIQRQYIITCVQLCSQKSVEGCLLKELEEKSFLEIVEQAMTETSKYNLNSIRQLRLIALLILG